MKFITKLTLILLLILPQIASAVEAPAPLKQIFQKSFLIGDSDLKVFGLKVYHISLWSEDAKFSYDKKFAINILYNMNFKREELAQRSIDEIEKLHHLSAEEENNYLKQLRSIFHSVKKGDQKLATFSPQEGLTMYYNDKITGKISDPKLARFFVDIWLDEKGSCPKVTKKILGKN